MKQFWVVILLLIFSLLSSVKGFAESATSAIAETDQEAGYLAEVTSEAAQTGFWHSSTTEFVVLVLVAVASFLGGLALLSYYRKHKKDDSK